MSNKDLVNPVLEGIVSDATNISRTNIEQTTPTDTTSTTGSNIQPTLAATTTTTTTTTTTKMSEEDIIIQQLQEEKRELQSQIDEIQEKREINTEKQIFLRNLRAKKHEVTRELRIILEKKNEEQYEEAYKRKIEDEKSKIEIEVNTIFGETTDVMKPDKSALPSFVRDFNMFGKYKDTINELRKEIHQLMRKDTSEMTQQLIDERDLMVQAKISTMKTIAKEYEKHYHNLTMVGEEKQIKYLIDKFTNVMETIHGLEASVKQEEETKKKKLALAKSETLESMKLEKFSGQGDNKYLKYYIWYTEFSELVMKKEYSDNVKLKFLKQYTEKDAHDLVKNYHHSQELKTAFEILDEHYGKPSMVIRESLRNLRMMETVKSINDVKANRALLSKINTNISTLKCYNFDLEGDDIENSSFLIEMEEKIPHIAYTKWEEEKIRLKAEEEEISIEGFIRFYTNLINIEEKAQYIRKQARPNESSYIKPTPRNLNLYHSTIKPTQPNQKRTTYRNQQPRKENFQGKIKGNFQGELNGAQNSANGGPSTPRYCIFCETNTHDTGFCKIAKYTAEYKTQQCQKHNACYMCFKTSEHKANTCPKIMKCLLCPRMHHFNNHTRQEINDYYNKKKKRQTNQ